MNTTLYAIRVGLSRGWLEFRAGLANGQEVAFYLVMPAAVVWILFQQRGDRIDGTAISVATLSFPGVLGMMAAYGAMIGVAYSMCAEREDGTLLRAKAVPNGMVGYVTGGVVRVSMETVVTLLLVLLPCLLFIEGLRVGALGAVTLVWVLVLGLLATLPLGMVIGSLMKSPRAVGGWGFLATGSVVAVSGIFYPITALAGWVQVIGQFFPIYWIGLGLRAALLPDEAAAVEIGGSWRYPGMVGALLAWAVVGLLIAPVVLRRMARRESGSSVAERRQKAMQRI